MNDMMTICRTTYTRVLRTRSLYVLLVAVIVLVGVAHLYNDLTAGRQKELMYDAAGALLTLVGLFTALIAPFDIARDLREKVVLTLLSKPLGRGHYLMGKFLGVVYLVTINLAILTIGMLLLLKAEQNVWRLDFLQLAMTTWGAMIMTIGVGVMFASFLSELPATILTLVVYIGGHATESLYRTGTKAQHIFMGLFPGFGLLNFKTELGNGVPISWGLVAMAVVYAVAYTGALLSLANIFFHKRDLA